MSKIDVRAINLNLLPALEALLTEGSVSGAARRAHVTQSAMSHALGKLRELFGDPLLVPAGRGLAPTPRARQLAAQLPAALDRLGEVVTPPEPFEPAQTRRVFRVASVDFFELTVLPVLLAYLSKHAPHARLEVDRIGPGLVPALVAGEVDLALVSSSSPLPTVGLRRASLLDDPFVVLARRGHPVIKRRLTLETYLALGHVLVSIEGRRDGAVDRALARLGHERTVALRVPHIFAAPLAVERSDYLCTIAASVARRACETWSVRAWAPPITLPAAGIVALWSRRLDEDPGARWFRELFLSGRVLPGVPRSGRSRPSGPGAG